MINKGKTNSINKILDRSNAIYQALPFPTYTWQHGENDFELVDFNKAAAQFEMNGEALLLGTKASHFYRDAPEILSDFHACWLKKSSFECEWTAKLGSEQADHSHRIYFTYIDSQTILVQIQPIASKPSESQSNENFNQLASFIEGSPAALAMFDTEMRYIAVSKKWIQDYGLNDQELLGKSHYEVFPEIQEEWKMIHQRCLLGVIEKREEDVFIRADGSKDWLRWEIRPWNKENGEIGGLIFYTENISERKKAEDELIASENRFHLLAHNSLVGTYILKEGRFTYLNPAMAKIFGYTVDEMLGKSPADLVDSCGSAHKDNLSDSEPANHHYFCVGTHKNGSLLDIEVFDSIIEINGKQAVIGSLIDSTERKQAEEQIRLQAEKLNQILQNLPIGLSMTNSENKLTYYNRKLTELIGYTVEEIPDLDTWWLTAYPDPIYREQVKKTWYEKIGKSKATGDKCEPVQAIIRCKDGTDKIFEGYFAQIGNESITIFQDISGLKQTERLLKENNDRISLQNEQLLMAKSKIQASENRLLEAQKAAKVGSWQTQLSDLSVIWSEETYSIFELNPETFSPTHESFLTFVHPEDRSSVAEAFVNSAQTENYHSIEHRIITAKGNVKFVEEHWKTIFSEDGLPNHVVGTCQDISERKKAEQELRATKKEAEENEFRLALAAEAAKLGIWDWNVQNNILLWDDRSYAIYGLQRENEDNLMEFWTNSLHPEDRDRTMGEVAAALSGEKKYSTTYRIRKRSGDILHLKADGLVLFDSFGIPYRMIGMVQDITESVQYENKIKQSEEKHRALIENISDGVVLLDEFFHLIYQSPSAERIVGYSSGDEKGRSIIDMVHPDDVKICLNQHKSAKRRKSKPIRSEYRIQHKSGGYIWIEVAITNLLDLTSVEAYVVVYRDITERKKFEGQLALSSLIVNSSHDAIMSISPEGIITSWNTGAEKVLGYMAEEIVGKPIYILISEELHGEEKMIAESIQNKQLLDHYETVRLKKGGEPIHVSLTVSPILDELGNVIGASKIMRDITVQKAAVSEKAKIMQQLILRNRDLEQFAYIISHNLRAPVANIIGINTIMQDEENGPEEKEQLTRALNQSVEAMDTVIKDLNHILQLKLEVKEQRSLVYFSSLVKEISFSIANLINSEEVVLKTDFSEQDELITIKSYLYSIFYNLIINSIKYKQPNVRPVIEIKSKRIGTRLELVFRDNGLGIDMDKKGNQVFGLYKRFHFHTEGKGMGLFMVKTQVETLNGTISLKSEVNKGTEFTLEFDA